MSKKFEDSYEIFRNDNFITIREDLVWRPVDTFFILVKQFCNFKSCKSFILCIVFVQISWSHVRKNKNRLNYCCLKLIKSTL